MDNLFNILSSSARIDKSKRKKRKIEVTRSPASRVYAARLKTTKKNDDSEDDSVQDSPSKVASRDKTGKRDTSEAKLQQIHKENVAAFRRSMAIRLGDKHDPDIPDPISSFRDLAAPSWWTNHQDFQNILRRIGNNIERGKWKEPTPIQMQALPTLLQRRDFVGAAPTGSGKSGSFIIPALFLSSASYRVFYGADESKTAGKRDANKSLREGEIRSLLLAPSRELAAQLHREVERLGIGKPCGLTSLLLSKSNAANVISGGAGGKSGLDVLVTTPLRLVDAIEKGLDLSAVRVVVLDEADRLLDAADGKSSAHLGMDSTSPGDSSESSDDDLEVRKKSKHRKKFNPARHEYESKQHHASGTSHTQSFLAQMDNIFSALPATATRSLFSATVTPAVRSLAESILRNPVDVTVATPGTMGGANVDIEQELRFVGREEGKLLAIRQLVQRGELLPPAIVFVQSQERAQALFSELVYDGIHVDVIHAGRSQSARDSAVARFRRGDTWLLICTDLVARGIDFRAVNMVINYDLPTSGVTYVHRVGRTGRAGRKGKAITLFTEADFESLRTIANVMKFSGCEVPEWMLNLHKGRRRQKKARKRPTIDTTSSYDKLKKIHRQQSIQNSKKRKNTDTGKTERPKKQR